MGHFKSFLLGLFTAYGIYYITKKTSDGKSILDDLLANPAEFMQKVKDNVMHDAAQTIKDGIS
jgi:hypothetical protein